MMKSANITSLNPAGRSPEFDAILTYALDQMDTMTGVLDAEGKFIFANRAALKNIGATREQIRGVPFSASPWRNHSPEAKKAMDEMIARALAGESSIVEDSIIDSDGRLIPTLFSISPVRNAAGKVAALITEAKVISKLEITDISEQVSLRELMLAKEYSSRLEKEVNKVTTTLRKTEQFNKNLIDSTPLGIIYLNNNDRVMFANPAMEQKLKTVGIPKDRIVGETLPDLGIFLTDHCGEKITDPHQQKITPGQVKMRLCGDGKNNRQFEVQAAPLRSSTRGVNGTILIMADVTERNCMEEELLRTRIQSEKMNSVELLISGVAHELNNPLTSIIGCAEYLVENRSFSKDAGEALRIIISDARRAGEIVKNLLTFARQPAPEKATVNLNEVIVNVLGIRTHELRNRRIKAVLEMDQDIQPVEADVTQMQQVVLNLIGNAADAMEESGVGDQITLRTRTEGSWVIMDVEDNGPGIPKEYLPKIFDPFFTTKQPGKGVGLGLSIAYGILQKHGGSIAVNMSPDSGTRFTIRLPLFVSPRRQRSRILPSPTGTP